jgi:hypothetical protein
VRVSRPSIRRMEIPLLTAFTNAEAEEVTIRAGASAKSRLRFAARTPQFDNKGRRMGKSEIVERELLREGWRKARVWAPEGRPSTGTESRRVLAVLLYLRS